MYFVFVSESYRMALKAINYLFLFFYRLLGFPPTCSKQMAQNYAINSYFIITNSCGKWLLWH